jgi:polyhydroxyalkanoic acid synthase PhaR subunit
MSESTNDNKDPQPVDPLEAWRKWRDSSLEIWSKSMIETVNSEAYSSMTGTMLDTYLTASGPFREAVSKSMLQALQQMNLPTREDFESIAERMTHIEMRLDDLDAKLEGRLKKEGGK